MKEKNMEKEFNIYSCAHCLKKTKITIKKEENTGIYTIKKECETCNNSEILSFRLDSESSRFLEDWLTSHENDCECSKNPVRSIYTVYSIARTENEDRIINSYADRNTKYPFERYGFPIYSTFSKETSLSYLGQSFSSRDFAYKEIDNLSPLTKNEFVLEEFKKNPNLKVCISLAIDCPMCHVGKKLIEKTYFKYFVSFYKVLDLVENKANLIFTGYHQFLHTRTQTIYKVMNFMKAQMKAPFGELTKNLVLGADPELMAESGVYAANFLSKTHSAYCNKIKCKELCGMEREECDLYQSGFDYMSARIGTDGCSDVFEIRPAPSNSVITLFNNIAAIMQQLTNMTRKQKVNLYSGSYKSNQSIGGHIHFSVRNRNSSFWEVFPDTITKNNCVIANNILSEIFENPKERQQRERSYGQSEFRGQGVCHVEWRMPMSWLQTPLTCLSYLTIHKLAVLLAYEKVLMPSDIFEIPRVFAEKKFTIPDDCLFGLNILIKTNIINKYTDKKMRITSAPIGENWIRPKDLSFEEWLVSPPLLIKAPVIEKEDIAFLTNYSHGKKMLEVLKEQFRGYEIGIVPMRENMAFDAFLPCHEDRVQEIVAKFSAEYTTTNVELGVKSKFTEEICAPKLIVFLGKELRKEKFIEAIIKVISELLAAREKHCNLIVQELRKEKLKIYEEIKKEEGEW